MATDVELAEAELAAAAARSKALLDVFQLAAPVPVKASRNQDDWNAIGPALVARCAQLTRSVVVLQTEFRILEAEILARSLYEHAVAFAWIGIDPHNHARRWLMKDREHRVKAEHHARELGVSLLSDERLQKFEKELEEGPKPMPANLVQLAQEADRHWANRLPDLGLTGSGSLEGLYIVYYRNFSSTTHPTALSLNRVLTETATPGHFLLDVSAGFYPQNAFTSVGLLFGMALLLSAEILGWPDERAVHNVFEFYSA